VTTRSDVAVNFNLSPRIIEVADPSVIIIAQDTVDTLRDKEDDFRGMSEFKLLNASGKDDLGGGVLVGITAALQNAQIAFESRLTPTSTGTITTPDTTGITLIDGSATFESDGVTRGAVVINFTDQSITEVLSIDGQDQLTCRVLRSGSDNQFDSADAYKVWNVIQCDISGGNVVAVDTDGVTPISPVFPTAFTQIVRTSSSSATLQELQDIQFSSFNGGVTVDIGNITGLAVAGTAFPAGTRRQPSANFADALTIAATNGLFRLYILGDATLDTPDDFSNFEIIGENENKSSFTLNTGAVLTGAEISNATITGTLDGETHVSHCVINNITFINGQIEQCLLIGTTTLGGTGVAHFLDCASGVPGASTPIINMGGSGVDLALRNYSGGIQIDNCTAAQDTSIDLNSGQIILDSTVTNGNFVLRGVGKLTDNSTGTTITNELISGIATDIVEGALTVQDALRIIMASAAGKLSGAETLTVSIRDTTDTTDRIVATVDANGNRTAVTLDAS